MSNTSIGRGEKGSKFWMQTLVSMCEEYLLNDKQALLDKRAEINARLDEMKDEED